MTEDLFLLALWTLLVCGSLLVSNALVETALWLCTKVRSVAHGWRLK